MALDMQQGGRKVALKLMRNRTEFVSEITHRQEVDLSMCVVRILGLPLSLS